MQRSISSSLRLPRQQTRSLARMEGILLAEITQDSVVKNRYNGGVGANAVSTNKTRKRRNLRNQGGAENSEGSTPPGRNDTKHEWVGDDDQ